MKVIEVIHKDTVKGWQGFSGDWHTKIYPTVDEAIEAVKQHTLWVNMAWPKAPAV